MRWRWRKSSKGGRRNGDEVVEMIRGRWRKLSGGGGGDDEEVVEERGGGGRNDEVMEMRW